MDTATPKRQTDVRRRTVAPTTLQNLLAASSGAQSAVNDLKSDEALDKLEEELNRRVDEETQVLVQGMADLVGMSVVSPFFESGAGNTELGAGEVERWVKDTALRGAIPRATRQVVGTVEEDNFFFDPFNPAPWCQDSSLKTLLSSTAR